MVLNLSKSNFIQFNIYNNIKTYNLSAQDKLSKNRWLYLHRDKRIITNKMFRTDIWYNKLNNREYHIEHNNIIITTNVRKLFSIFKTLRY